MQDYKSEAPFNITIKIKGKPHFKNGYGFDEGKFRIRINKILEGVAEYLDKIGVPYHRQMTGMFPRWTNGNGLLTMNEAIVLDDVVSDIHCTNRAYFYVKMASNSRATYNARAELIGFVGPDIRCENFRTHTGSACYITRDSNEYNTGSRYYNFSDENENGEVDIAKVVDIILKFFKFTSDKADEHRVEAFRAKVMATQVAGHVSEIIKKINNEGGAEGVKFIEARDGDGYNWFIKDTPLSSSYQNALEFSVIPVTDGARLKFKNYVDYTNNLESSIFINKHNMDNYKEMAENLVHSVIENYHYMATLIKLSTPE